jgi:TRAP-type C4-dicarboxylate transport system permease small subunit
MFRRLLDTLYNACGALACLAMLAIVVIVVAQIVCRLFNILIPSAGDFAGYALVASTFLGLAYTFRRNGHIRVSIVNQRLSRKWRRRSEIYALLVGIGILGYFTWYAGDMVWTSFDFGDVSDGLIPTPLWIPQSAILLGVLLMTVAMIDELIVALRGQLPTYVSQEPDIFQGE